jgi:hypothetical protein
MDPGSTFTSGGGSGGPILAQPWRTGWKHRLRKPGRAADAERLSDTSTTDLRETTIEIHELKEPENTHWPLPQTPDTPGESLKRWPETPQPITNEYKVEVILDTFDIVICLVPVALIVKAGLCILANAIDTPHKGPLIDQTSDLTLKLIEFNSQLTTIFTIVFIIIVSSALRRFTLWRAERGATIGQLEQLQSSMSMAGTLKAVWSLRAFTTTSLALIFLWSWYYVGSQASEREYRYQDSGPFQDEHVAFLGSQAISPFEDGSIVNISSVRKTDMTSRYHMYSQFTAGSQGGQTTEAKSITGADIFGNSLTPWFGPERGQSWSKVDIDRDGWLEIKHMSTQPIVSSIGPSLYRQNISNPGLTTDEWVPAKMIGSFTYPTSYFVANCTAPVVSKSSGPAGLTPYLATAFNMSAPASDADAPRRMDYWHWVNATTSLVSSCEMTRQSVTIKAACTAATCKPLQMKLLHTSPRTLFDNDSFAGPFFDSMLLACGTPARPGDFSTFDNDNGLVPLRALLATNASAADPRVAALAAASQFPLSAAVTRFVNTYFAASQMLRYEHDLQASLAVSGSVSLAANADFSFVDLRGAVYEPQHVLSLPWLVADILSNVVLLACAATSFWLRKHTLAPDIFGFVSSLTRDNPHFQLPAGGSTLSGIDRARRMKHVKVKIGDIGSSSGRPGVGRVGIVNAGEMPTTRDLEKGKVYY